MRLIIVLFLFVVQIVPALHAVQKTSIEADNADYDGQRIRMAGAVSIKHEFGNIRCDKGVLLMKESAEKRLDLDRILLYGSVKVEMHDGSVLTAEEADINCETLEGVFVAAAPQKVVYVTRVEEEGRAVPVKTMSRSMRITMKKQEAAQGQKSQYVIHDVQADGSVNIEYQQEE